MSTFLTHPIEVSEEAGIRYLHFGSDWVQGAMRVRRPFALELEYTRQMAAGLLLRPAPWPRRVLMIGLGPGSLAKFFYHHVPGCKISVVEIDPRVVQIARSHFRLPEEDARLAIVIGDGADYVTRRSGYWDAILVDGFDYKAQAGALATEPFYAACRAALSEGGLFTANLFGQRRGFKTALDQLKRAFDGHIFALPACASGNVIVFAHGGETLALNTATLRARAADLKANTGLDLRQVAAQFDPNF
ncbi:MAG: fused MFS/spermidine synthase [Betaproteobacteria bacterium]|nr:fused MFS/spermidine synthase [Betaproteobacteria bacterium]